MLLKASSLITYLPFWIEGMMPIVFKEQENVETQIQDERRLAYVGITRARKQLMISYHEFS